MPEIGTSTIIEQAKRFIEGHYEEHFGDEFPFHNHLHAFRVYKQINILGEAENVTPEEEMHKYDSWYVGKGRAEIRERGAGRPTKRQRREIDDFKDDYSIEEDV